MVHIHSDEIPITSDSSCESDTDILIKRHQVLLKVTMIAMMT